MRILGIDPGYATIGFGLITAERAQVNMLTYGAITTPAGLPLSRRLYQIGTDMEDLIGQLKPDVISIEELFFNTNLTTGIAVAHARGVLLYTAEKCGIPLHEYTPSQVKMAVVGYGKAEKRQVMDMTRRLLHLKRNVAQQSGKELQAGHISIGGIEIVPAPNKRKHRNSGDSRTGVRQHDGSKNSENSCPIHPGCLLQLMRKPGKKLAQDIDEQPVLDSLAAKGHNQHRPRGVD